jgi:hypothetical protein
LDGSKRLRIGGVTAAFIFGGVMNIDKTLVSDTQSKLLFNISEQLEEIISLLKPQEVKTQEPEEIKEEFKCKCGKEFEKKRQLTAHKIKCKNKG